MKSVLLDFYRIEWMHVSVLVFYSEILQQMLLTYFYFAVLHKYFF